MLNPRPFQDSNVFVERRDGDSWQLVAEDADPETRLIAAKKERHVLLTVRWQVPADTPAYVKHVRTRQHAMDEPNTRD